MNIQDCHRPPKPAPPEPPGRNGDGYGDGDIPEIDTTRNQSETTSTYPEEMPKRGQML